MPLGRNVYGEADSARSNRGEVHYNSSHVELCIMIKLFYC